MSEFQLDQLISVRQAVGIIDSVEVIPRVESVPMDRACGRVLAEPVVSDRDYPPFEKAVMDGFAVRSTDATGAGVTLRVVAEIAAGRPVEARIGPCESAAIMTGAPLPPGADAVVPVELTESPQPGTVRLLEAVRPGRCVMPRGGDIASGTTLIEPGTRLGPVALGVLTTVGATAVACYARPRCAVLATGDELTAPDAQPMPWQIRNSNNPMIRALLERIGGDVVMDQAVPDDPQAIRGSMARAADAADVVFVSGGMSMGRYDFVPAALIDLGFEPKVTKLRIRPGKPFVFAMRDGNRKYAFGLPGNPVSAFVCTARLASRLIRRMVGLPPEPRWVQATLAAGLDANGPREFYQPAWWDGSVVTPLAWKGSADLFTLSRSNALIVREENEAPRSAGEQVRVLEVT